MVSITGFEVSATQNVNIYNVLTITDTVSHLDPSGNPVYVTVSARYNSNMPVTVFYDKIVGKYLAIMATKNRVAAVKAYLESLI